MFKVSPVLVFALIHTLTVCSAWAQNTQATMNSQANTHSTGPTGLKCPDKLAVEACASFAKDKQPLEKGEVVCFRQAKNEYFELLYGSYQTAPWDSVDKDGLPTNGAKASHLFIAKTMSHGVENGRRMPHAKVPGTWYSNGVYSSSTEGEDHDLSLAFDGHSLSFTNKYNERLIESITYALRVDLATKRFTEEWNSHSGGVDERDVGRCIVVP